jgi:fructose-bisphosphate aldolase class I
MHYEELSDTIEHLLQPGKGILAADESNGTIAKRFASIGIENSAANRQSYRLLLATTPDLDHYINGVILFEETFENKDSQGTPIAELFLQKNILPGIKVDKGLVDLANTEGEKVTQGLDGLLDRLLHFKALGARFAKWRNVYSISDYTPSLTAMKAGAEVLARYAATCQAAGIVPIVEPEILMDGEHSIEQAAEVAEMVLHELFKSLFTHQVELEHMILKPSMVTCGKNTDSFSTPEEIADFTLCVFRNHVPAAVPSINFLSGGQTPDEATANLSAINSCGEQPWNLSFSFGRALQDECLHVWAGKEANVHKAQEALLNRAQLSSNACFGECMDELCEEEHFA